MTDILMPALSPTMEEGVLANGTSNRVMPCAPAT